MSLTESPRLFVDLYTALMNAIHMETTKTANVNQAKRQINEGLLNMHMGHGEKFSWAERHGWIHTHPKYEEGTLSINQGSASLTGSGTAWNTNDLNGVANIRTGGRLTIDSGSEVYEIRDVTNDTSATLLRNFVGKKQSGSITAFANAGGGQVTVTSSAHGLANNMNVQISGTTSYNGVFTIASVTADTFAITDTFVADDATGEWQTGAVSAASYVYFEDEYSLEEDFLKPLDQQNFADGYNLPLISRTQFRRQYPRNHIPGTPRVATIYDRNLFASSPQAATDYPTRRVRFHPAPDRSMIIPYAYVTSHLVTNLTDATEAGEGQEQFVDDNDEPIMPLQYRYGIVLYALSEWYRDKRDDTRSAEVRALYETFLQRVVQDTDIGSTPRPRLRPATSVYVSRARNPYSGSGQRFDVNGRFDRMEDVVS